MQNSVQNSDSKFIILKISNEVNSKYITKMHRDEKPEKNQSPPIRRDLTERYRPEYESPNVSLFLI